MTALRHPASGCPIKNQRLRPTPAGRLERPSGSHLFMMASVGMEVLKYGGTHLPNLPAEAEGGNPGEYSSESPEGLAARQATAKDRLYNRHRREVGRRWPDWRIGSPSGDGRENITQPERGPQGPGEVAKATIPYFDAGVPFGGSGYEGRSKPSRSS